jgi:hypothetical protein
MEGPAAAVVMEEAAAMEAEGVAIDATYLRLFRKRCAPEAVVLLTQG